jgi:hypothetical protein
MKYTTADGQLWIADEGGRITFHGALLGGRVRTVLPIEGTRDAIALLDYMGGPKVFANLLRVTPEGEVVWRAAPPDHSADAWVSLGATDPVRARSWSGFLCVIDSSSGEILESVFTK